MNGGVPPQHCYYIWIFFRCHPLSYKAILHHYLDTSIRINMMSRTTLSITRYLVDTNSRNCLPPCLALNMTTPFIAHDVTSTSTKFKSSNFNFHTGCAPSAKLNSGSMVGIKDPGSMAKARALVGLGPYVFLGILGLGIFCLLLGLGVSQDCPKYLLGKVVLYWASILTVLLLLICCLLCAVCIELVSLHKMNNVALDDYDASLCQELYSDDNGYAQSTRSDAVRCVCVVCGVCVWCVWCVCGVCMCVWCMCVVCVWCMCVVCVCVVCVVYVCGVCVVSVCVVCVCVVYVCGVCVV